MKINRIALTIVLGGTMLPWELAVAADRIPLPKPLTSTGRIGDAPNSVDNSVANAQRPVLSADLRPEAFRQNVMAVDQATLPSVAPSELEQRASKAGFHTTAYSTTVNENSATIIGPTPDPYVSDQVSTSMSGSATCCTDSCRERSCAVEGCASESCGIFGRNGCSGLAYHGFLGGLCADSCEIGCGRRTLGWLRSDAILWWGPDLNIVDLVVRGPRSQPVVFDEVVIGSNTPLQTEMMPGMKLDFGFWLDGCESVGAGGRFFTLFSDPTSQTVSSSGESLGIPYYDPSQLRFVVFTAAADFGAGNGVDTGSVTVSNDIDFIAADAYGSLLMARSGKARADVIGGYTFARLDSSLGVELVSVDGSANFTPDGTVLRTNDSFSTSNTFHGGHVGFTTEVSRGRLAFSTLGKVSIGTVEQRIRALGRATSTLNGQVSSTNTGLLVQASNSLDATRQLPSFLPEGAAKFRYYLKPNLSLNVGYTFLFFPDVVLATNMIDTTIDFEGTTTTAPVRPAPKVDNVSYYLHGIDVGLAITF